MPLLVTVGGTAPECRYRIAERLLKYYKAKMPMEVGENKAEAEALWQERPYLKLKEWNADDVNPDFERLGLGGSATKVKQIENVVLLKKENVNVATEPAAIEQMWRDLQGVVF